MSYDFNRPMISIELMDAYKAIDSKTARSFGKTVKATFFSNADYNTHYGRLSEKQRMNFPPSAKRIFPGYIVVRNLGKENQYETWTPDMVFEELCQKVETD